MMETFKAILVTKDADAKRQNPPEIVDLVLTDLMEGNVTIRVEHTTMNYKDGLALTGKAPVVRRFPLIPGIDLAGTVTASSHTEYVVGDRVLLNGWGVGEVHHGGYAGVARVSGDWLIPLPQGLDTAQAMAIGTAGYTAMLCLLALERQGVAPTQGPVVVTGAAGGVGSIAVALLARAGFDVVASTGRTEEASYLRSLGAKEVIDRTELSGPAKPLAKERWVAAVDTVGSTTLANVLAATRYGGAVAACGLAGGMDLPATVAPFILRGVSLLGVDSVMAPTLRRIEAWDRLARDLDRDLLASLTTEIAFDDLIPTADRILAGQVRGRLVVPVA